MPGLSSSPPWLLVQTLQKLLLFTIIVINHYYYYYSLLLRTKYHKLRESLPGSGQTTRAVQLRSLVLQDLAAVVIETLERDLLAVGVGGD